MPAIWGLGALLALTVAAALFQGGWRERAAAGALLAVSLATVLMPDDPRVGPAVWLLLAADLAVVALLGRMAWKAPGAWPVWMMAPQAVAAAASLAFALQPDVVAETYLRGLLLTRYAAALALLIGASRRRSSHL